MDQSINDRAMEFTRLVEALLRKGSEEVPGSYSNVTETTVIDAMYGLRAAIERDAQQRREAASTPA